MYTVIPIGKSPGKDTLTYFGKENIALGSLVEVPLRKREVLAMVLGCEDVKDKKHELRGADFSLRKISKIIAPSFLDTAFLDTIEEVAKESVTTQGSVLSSLLPKIAVEEIKLFSKQSFPNKEINAHEKLLIQADDEERFAHYKSYIRGEFAKKRSVFFCVPTKEDGLTAKELLEKGIEQFTVVLHRDMGKKEFRAAVKTIQDESHPLIIIATIPFIFISREDIRTIIIERENSRNYRTLSRPFIDLRTIALVLSEKRNLKFIAGDSMLSVETIWRKKQDEFIEFAPLKFRSLSSAKNELIDMTTPEGKERSPFRILSNELEQLISKTKENNEHIFLYAARKGLSPTTLCGDCGQIVTCTKCAAPVILYGTARDQKENTFICNRCGETESAMRRCALCNSWKLKALGIGIEGVEKELKERFPDVTVFVIDKDHTSTAKKAREVRDRFYQTPGSILLGTEMAIPYLHETIEHTGVVSIDSLLAVPDFRMSEKILYILLKMRARSSRTFLLQTRNPKEKLFEYALKGNLLDFYRDELEVRKEFSYPPFSVCIKLSLEGTPAAAHKAMDEIEELLDDYTTLVFESAYPSKRGKIIMHAIVKIERGKWPDPTLISILESLPPYVAVKVDPDSFL